MGECCDPASKKFCIWNIPICGGFCAPTDSNEPSCFRHFSNEFTLPGAPRFAQLLPICEHSCFCINVGKQGCACADKFRKAVMMFSFSCNLIAMLLFIISAVGGLATQPDRLKSLAWVKGTGSINGTSVTMNMGLVQLHHEISCLPPAARATWLQNPLSRQWSEGASGCFWRTMSWDDDDLCRNVEPEIGALCDDCKNSRLSTGTLIMSIVTMVPTMATNLQRTTRFGDVNCQATMGILTNFVSLLSSIASLVSFKTSCMENLPTQFMNVDLTWQMGLGFQLLLFGTLLKIVDIICHCAVPTPRQRWQSPGPEVKTTLDYLSLAPPEPEVMTEKDVSPADDP